MYVPRHGRSTFVALTIAVASLSFFVSAEIAAEDESDESAVVYLVRHAEKTQDTEDPGLTPYGKERAAALADILVDRGVDRILSSDFRRTRETATPLANRLGVEVELYDAEDLGNLARHLREAEAETILVVGHSNTTPDLVEALGGDPGPPIEEDEYDRLYRIDLPSGRTVLERFNVVTVPME